MDGHLRWCLEGLFACLGDEVGEMGRLGLEVEEEGGIVVVVLGGCLAYSRCIRGQMHQVLLLGVLVVS